YVAFIHPFYIIRPDHEPDYRISIEDVNRNNYNSWMLCRIVAALHIPNIEDLRLLVCGDGALALPMVSGLQSFNDVLDALNAVLSSLLLGGLLCEAIDSRDVVEGHLHKKTMIWPTNMGNTFNSYIHSGLRMKMTTSFETIRLSGTKNISVTEFVHKYEVG